MDWAVFKSIVDGWSRHRCTRLGAALAYYAVFSVGPLLLIVASVAGLFFGEQAARREMLDALRDQMGQTGIQAVEALLNSASSSETGPFAAITGTILLVIGALGVVVQLKDALNTIWEAERSVQSSWWALARSYFVSLVGVLALGLLLAASIVISAVIGTLLRWMGTTNEVLWEIATWALSLLILTITFALLYRCFPNAVVRWKAALTAGGVTAVLFQLGTIAISWFIGTQALQSTYGAASSLVVVLIWVYYSSQSVLVGAELSRALSMRHQKPTNVGPVR